MLDSIINLAGKFGVLDQAKNKLMKQPDPAAEKLGEVLKELSKTYQAIDTELTNYLGIWFDANDVKGVAAQRKILISLEGGNVKVRMAESRGHCSKIRSIYERFLSPWFARVLDDSENRDIKDLFENLTSFDLNIIFAIDELADWLQYRAGTVLDMIGNADYLGANQEIERDRIDVRDARVNLSVILMELFQLQADFINITGAL